MERLWESAQCETELEQDPGKGYFRNVQLFQVATWRKFAERLMSHSTTSNPLMSEKHSDKLVLLKQTITPNSLHLKITARLELTLLTSFRHVNM